MAKIFQEQRQSKCHFKVFRISLISTPQHHILMPSLLSDDIMFTRKKAKLHTTDYWGLQTQLCYHFTHVVLTP